MDLLDRTARRALFATVDAPAARVLVLTEGLLSYLSDDQVAGLAQDLHTPASFRWWMIDLISPLLLKRLQKMWSRQLAAGNSKMQFAPAAGTEFFLPYGWKLSEFRSSWEEAHRLKREMWMAWFLRFINHFASERRRETFRKLSGVALLERA